MQVRGRIFWHIIPFAPTYNLGKEEIQEWKIKAALITSTSLIHLTCNFMANHALQSHESSVRMYSFDPEIKSILFMAYFHLGHG